MYAYIYIPSGYLLHSHGKWPIEIDGLPINSMVIFHGYVTNNQRVYIYNRKTQEDHSHGHSQFMSLILRPLRRDPNT